MCVSYLCLLNLSYVFIFLSYGRQGMSLLDEDVLKSWPQRPWHVKSRPSLHKWLQAAQSLEDKSRLACIGNIVMPDVGFLALQLLGHQERAEG